MSRPLPRRVAIGAVFTLAAVSSAPGSQPGPTTHPRADRTPPVELIAAPSNLGLKPLSAGHEPGTWRAPAALLAAGLAERLHAADVVQLERPRYDFEKQRGTGTRNGTTLRQHGLRLADAVDSALARSRFPVVLGGDCSILLGCLAGARRSGRVGLVHVDGHSDFFHPGNYDTERVLGAAAGMDLALATGRGEPLLARWPPHDGPLVADADVVQIGDRDRDAYPCGRDCPGLIGDAAILQITAQELLRLGMATGAERAVRHLEGRCLDRVWLHVDLDVLDQGVMPAVDSPGTPGPSFEQLGELLAHLVASGRVVGLDVAIYDPELDPGARLAPSIVDLLAKALGAFHGSPRVAE